MVSLVQLLQEKSGYSIKVGEIRLSELLRKELTMGQTIPNTFPSACMTCKNGLDRKNTHYLNIEWS